MILLMLSLELTVTRILDVFHEFLILTVMLMSQTTSFLLTGTPTRLSRLLTGTPTRL